MNARITPMDITSINPASIIDPKTPNHSESDIFSPPASANLSIPSTPIPTVKFPAAISLNPFTKCIITTCDASIISPVNKREKFTKNAAIISLSKFCEIANLLTLMILLKAITISMTTIIILATSLIITQPICTAGVDIKSVY